MDNSFKQLLYDKDSNKSYCDRNLKLVSSIFITFLEQLSVQR